MTDEQQFSEAWTQIRAIHRDYSSFYQLMLGALFVLIGVVIGLVLFGGDKDYLSNLYANGLSIFIVLVLVNWMLKRQRIEKIKEHLLIDIAIGSNQVALRALNELKYYEHSFGQANWFKGARLTYADLQGAKLSRLDLRETTLEGVLLHNAQLFNTNLQGVCLDYAEFDNARLGGANLQGASLKHASFLKANLSCVNLESAILEGTDLKGANLKNSNLEGAKLVFPYYSNETILPDGTNWSEDTDMSRFTDPQHPQFWRSDSRYSPAFHSLDKSK